MFLSPNIGQDGSKLAPSWPMLGQVGEILGLCWPMLAHLGAMLGDLEAMLRYVELFFGRGAFCIDFYNVFEPQGISLETVNKEFLVNSFPWFLVNLLTRNSLLRNSQGNFPW